MGNQESKKIKNSKKNECSSQIKYLKKLKKKIKEQQTQIDDIENNLQKQKQQQLQINKQTDFNDREFLNNTKYQNLNLRSLTAISNTNGNTPAMATGRTITHINNTSIALDLYMTQGGADPQPIKLLVTLNPLGQPGNTFVFNILDYDSSVPQKPIGYNLSYNFNVLKSGDPIPQYNAGPTLVEFGTNQIWSGLIPDLRDTFDISCVPAGIGNLLCNNGQSCRDQAVSLSLAAGYTQQQAYNYNVGAQIIPPNGTAIPSGNLATVSVSNSTAPYSSQAITYPLDTALPKQQTGSAKVGVAGNYIVNWINPVVSLQNYN